MLQCLFIHRGSRSGRIVVRWAPRRLKRHLAAKAGRIGKVDSHGGTGR